MNSFAVLCKHLFLLVIKNNYLTLSWNSYNKNTRISVLTIYSLSPETVHFFQAPETITCNYHNDIMCYLSNDLQFLIHRTVAAHAFILVYVFTPPLPSYLCFAIIIIIHCRLFRLITHMFTFTGLNSFVYFLRELSINNREI